MAQKAKKDRAKSNTSTLNTMHLSALTLNILFLSLSTLWLKRSLTLYIGLSIPAFICQFILERTGRPSYTADGKTLIKSGEDLAAPGLTEYMFDVIWVTWACLIAALVFGNKGWFIWLVVPIYGAYTAWGLFGKARGMMGGMQGPGAGAEGVGSQQQQQSLNRKQRRMAA